ncbi:hypothetical protein [Plesiomonas sp. PI-19]|uniref:hypothetical protein n=1 Tax=Plesiomonas sp. PI-19 TaxID=2898798 RepID=UPI001F3079EF|nr:hypothetical protein [Plesiomonas sp. PI-19]MCE5165631.1 hypothetical protein [Plesiomonas sp. PI-19]
MGKMFDDFDNDGGLDASDFINKTTQNHGYDVAETQSKSIVKTITINKVTLDYAEEMQDKAKVDFSQMVRAGILALYQMDEEKREALFKQCYVPRNAGRKKKY